MKDTSLPYHFIEPPARLNKARLDNIALVPASLLPRKNMYQTIANNLPGKGVLICQIDNTKRITAILEHVAAYFRQKGHVVKTIPFSLLI